MAKVLLTRADGSDLYVEPGLVDTVTEYTAAPPLSFITFSGEGEETRETVQGTPAAVVALLNAGGGGVVTDSGSYGPAGTPVAGPITLISGFLANWSRVGGVVTLSARFELTFASSGLCAFTFPPPSTPALPFTAGTVRGVVSYSEDPYFGTPSGDPDAIVYEQGANFRVEFGNNSGGNKRVTLVIQYQTP